MFLMMKPPTFKEVVMAVAAALLFLFTAGCALPFTRTIYVPPGKACQLRAPIKNAAVWEMDKNGKKVAATRDLAEGWMVLPMPVDLEPLKPVELE